MFKDLLQTRPAEQNEDQVKSKVGLGTGNILRAQKALQISRGRVGRIKLGEGRGEKENTWQGE